VDEKSYDRETKKWGGARGKVRKKHSESEALVRFELKGALYTLKTRREPKTQKPKEKNSNTLFFFLGRSHHP